MLFSMSSVTNSEKYNELPKLSKGVILLQPLPDSGAPSKSVTCCELVTVQLRLFIVFACPSVSDNYISIALHNVRSIIPKIPDIEHDDSLRSATILCFTEIWLTHQQPSPVLCDKHTVVRSDRVSGDNKGGVISMPQTMQASDATEFSFSGILIEAISTTLLLPNGEYLQLTVVYRSPSMSTDNLLISCLEY